MDGWIIKSHWWHVKHSGNCWTWKSFWKSQAGLILTLKPAPGIEQLHHIRRKWNLTKSNWRQTDAQGSGMIWNDWKYVVFTGSKGKKYPKQSTCCIVADCVDLRQIRDCHPTWCYFHTEMGGSCVNANGAESSALSSQEFISLGMNINWTASTP